MYFRVLVPLDLSARGELALEAVRKVASHGASIELFHVIERIEGLPERELSEFYDALESKADKFLEPFANALRDDGYHVAKEIRFGKRGPEILARADEIQCDLILLPSHALDPADPKRSFGSVSHQVALVASCPVLLVR